MQMLMKTDNAIIKVE